MLGFIQFSNAQTQKSDWDNWKPLLGNWLGKGDGKTGQGGGTFSFSEDLDKKVIIRKSHSEYPATANKPKIVHEDLMVIHQDQNGIPNKAVYFDNEGHTINYKITYQKNEIILLSEKVDKMPTFRLTYTLIDPNTVDTKFEMSQDGEKFFTYVQGLSTKQ